MAKNKKNIVVNEKKENSSSSMMDQKTQNITISLLVIACLLLVIILIIVIKGHEAKLKDGKEIIASVEEKEITSEDLFDELKAQYGTNILINTIDDFIANKEFEDDDAAKKYASAQLALLKQQYEAMGYKFSTVLANYGYDSEDDLLKVFISDYKKDKVVEKYLADNLSDDEINAYYENEIHGKLTVKHILIKPAASSSSTTEEKNAAEEAAKAKAQEVIQKLNEGATWADLVKEYSEDTASVPEEGLIADFDRDGVVTEFYDASLKLSDNEYTKEPVKSTYGYHVILKISEGEKPSLDSSKETIKSNLVSNKLSDDKQLGDKTWVQIRKNYKLEINDTKMDKVYKSIISELE